MKKPLRLFTATIAALFNFFAAAQPTDLFISEYVEGSSFNKAVEIYNGTSAAINLGTGQYLLEIYFNGNTTCSTVTLTGTVAAGSVYIVAHTSATLGVTPDQTSSSVSFNGDDAVVLRRGGASGPVLDVIGQVGLDPGVQWGANDTCTLDRTIRRKATVCQGDVTTSNAYYTEPEWDGYPQNTFAGLGSHNVSCIPSSNPLSLAPSALSFTTVPNIPSQPKSYIISGNSLTAAVVVNAPLFFELSSASTGPFTSAMSIPASSFTSPVTVYARYSPVAPGTDAGVAPHSSGSFSVSLNLSGVAVTLTPISQIQGAAAASPYAAQVIATQGVVTADFQGTNELGGFYIQDPNPDSNPLTSEGIFVSNTSYPVNIGDLVNLSGTAEEFFNRTQIRSLTTLSVQSTGNTIAPMTVTLPVSSAGYLETIEGMRVQFTQTLTVTEVYTLARFGEVALSAGGRLFTPTNFTDPNDQPASGTSSSGTGNVAAVLAQQNTNDLNRILLDDKSSVQNPPVVPYVDAQNNTLRCGSTLSNLNGVMDYAFSLYRIQPVVTPAFNYDPRPALPSVGNHNVKVASFNVLNYFNGNGTGGGFPTSRGANTAVEFTRQRNKIIEAIRQINADVVGLMEMENDGNSAQSAIEDLVGGLNSVMGAGTYTFVPDPTAANGGTGTDEIKVALIYKPVTLGLLGSSKADNNSVHNRPPLAQSFVLNSNQEKFSVIVNHFKSKSCSGSTGSNTDQNDGQSCFNNSRKLQAGALLSFVDTIKKRSGDHDVLVMGDINAYEQEDPMDLLEAGGLKRLLNNTYSYVFMGQSGSLDHALVSDSLFGEVSGAAKWHINADEPVAKDYNQEFNPAYLYSADPFRSSDHDPVMIGLNLQAPPVTTGLSSLMTAANLSIVNIIPNPSSQRNVAVEVVAGYAHNAGVEIHDALGRLMFHNNYSLNQGPNRLNLDLPELNAGLYYVSIKNEQGGALQKLVISK